MVLHVFISFLGGVPLCILYGLYSGTSLGGTTRGILGGFPGRVLSYSTSGRYFTHFPLRSSSLVFKEALRVLMDFGLTIRLWMRWGRVVILNSELGTEISEFRVVELLSVVRHQGFGDAKPAYDGSPHEITYFLLCDRGQRLGFSPLGEIIHCDDYELTLALSKGQRSQYVQTPLLERPGACD